MAKYIYFSLIIFLSLISFNSAAQDIPKCRTYDAIDMMLMKYPHLREQMVHEEEQLEIYTEEYSSTRAGDDDTYIVPVVFHIIHDGGNENISDEQVYDAMDILNRDFAMQNEDLENVVEEFTDVVSADINIEFKLAQRDPNGNCTNGIMRVQSPLTDSGDEDMKDLSRWPRDSYLNVWVCRDAGGAAGYTFVPSSVSGFFGLANDGIVLLHNYTGSIGTSNVNRSRTLTHEVGHWINLRHLWGPTNNPGEPENCDFDDGVADTPLSQGWTSCALGGSTCGSLDNVQNYMEYSYCSNMFTAGQRTRMRAALTSITAERNQLWQPGNLEATGVLEDPILCFADFQADQVTACAGTEILFTDLSFNFPQSWSWDMGDGTVLDGDDLSELEYSYSEPGIYTVALTVTDGFNEITVVKENLVSITPGDAIPTPLEEGFEAYGETLEEEQDWETIGQPSTENWRIYDNGGFEGENCLRIRNNNNVLDDVDELISNTMDFTGASEVVINYKWAFATKEEATDDRLRVFVSTDCGQSWSQKKLHRGFTDLPTAEPSNFQFFPDSQDDWSEHTIILDEEEYLGPSFKVRFTFQNFGGNNLYLDNINIGTALDLSLNEVILEDQVSLFPNPSSGNLTIDLTATDALVNETLLIYDLSGKAVHSEVISSIRKGNNLISTDLNHLAEGTYIVSIEQSGLSRFRKRWVKLR